MIEQWKDIPDFKGYYQASNIGRIRSVERLTIYKDGRRGIHKGKVLKQCLDKKGYLNVYLTKQSNKYSRKVHRLVLEAFVSPRPNEMQCRHYPDPNKTNNCLDNLQWGTASENQIDGVEHGTHRIPHRQGENANGAKMTKQQIIKIRQDKRVQREIAKDYGLSQQTISEIKTRKIWKHIK